MARRLIFMALVTFVVAVTDFVRWRVHDHMWPIFNVADAALLAGVALLLVDPIFSRRAEARRMLET